MLNSTVANQSPPPLEGGGRGAVTHIMKRLKLTLYFTRSNILSAMEYRTSFLMQVVGMIVNDAAFTVLWYIFFQSFKNVNGWGWTDTALLTAITTFTFGIVFVFAKGATDLARTIRQGELDYYLAFPVDLLWHLSVAKTRIDAIGDLVFGLVMFFAFTPVTIGTTVLFFGTSVLAACVMFSFIVVTQSLAFYVANIEDAARDIFELLLGFSFYPQNIFTGGIRVVMIFIIPAFFTATIPHDLVTRFEWTGLGLLAVAAVVSLAIAISFFRFAMRKYESGNLIAVRL